MVVEGNNSKTPAKSENFDASLVNIEIIFRLVSPKICKEGNNEAELRGSKENLDNSFMPEISGDIILGLDKMSEKTTKFLVPRQPVAS